MESLRWFRLALFACVTVVAVQPDAPAAPPWQKLTLFKRVEADPNKSYELTEDHGPWLVLATTFAGEKANERARELVYELRKEFKLKAYTHRVEFDFRNTAGKKLNRFGEAQRLRYSREKIDEVAVLVGDFPSVDDAEAQATLEKLKNAQPACLRPSEKRATDHPFAGYRGVWKTLTTGKKPGSSAEVKTVKKKTGPMVNALLTTNPLLPDEYYVPKGLDKFVVEMNKPVEFSLLRCSGRYTVKVATFSGKVIIDQKKIQQIEEGRDLGSSLATAAEKAHRLTEVLRAQGHEAYEFHDRGQSIVTIGSFNSYGIPRQDGKIEINPKIHAIMTTFGAERQLVPGQAAPNLGMPKVVADIPLDIQPMIVEVPKQSISGTYAERGLFGR